MRSTEIQNDTASLKIHFTPPSEAPGAGNNPITAAVNAPRQCLLR